jgi:hypothetical protein
MYEEIYGFCAADIHELAAVLAASLEVRLYRQLSPLIGPWYSSEDLASVIQAFRAGREVSQPARSLELILNDPEPGVTRPEFPGGGTCLLCVKAGAAELDAIEQALQDSGLRFKRLRRRRC